nr:hypothetical protein CFP56_04479 [Quercus suber]
MQVLEKYVRSTSKAVKATEKWAHESEEAGQERCAISLICGRERRSVTSRKICLMNQQLMGKCIAPPHKEEKKVEVEEEQKLFCTSPTSG